MSEPQPAHHRRDRGGWRPVVGPRQRPWLLALLALFAVLTVNSVYLVGVTIAERLADATYQDYFYQLMFLSHLALGLVGIPVLLIFAIGHMGRAWPRPNRRAVRAGLGLLTMAMLLIVSGLVLTRFGFLEVRDPRIRVVAYWLHVITPLLVIWLFVLHRLVGTPIRWRTGLGWLAVAGGFAGLMLVLHGQDPRDWDGADARAGDLMPSLARTASGDAIPARSMMMDGYCKQCHEDVHERWASSAHHLSSFNNPAYQFSVLETRRAALKHDGHVRDSRFCAGCHDPVPLFSGRFDDPDYDHESDPTADAGITCTVCHAITSIDSPRGNADYTIEEPVHYPFTFSESPFLQAINRQLIKAKPGFHKETFLKPLHEGTQFCGTCHKVHLPEAVNDYRWLRGQNHYDSFLLSGVSGHGIRSFYYPEQAVPDCAACHMPGRVSDDFAARRLDDSGKLKVHDHLFPAANTAVPVMTGQPEWAEEAHRSFLKGAMRVDIFGVRDGGSIDGELTAPIRPRVPALQRGHRYLLETVIRNLETGHLFTQGTADSNQVWLDVTVRSGGRVIGRSGGMTADGRVDPWSHFVNAYVLDREGNRIDRRNAQDIFVALYNHQIPPGATDVVHYALTVPPGAGDTVTVEVALRYRKFDTTYLRYIRDDPGAENDLPVVTIATDEVTFPVAGGGEVRRATREVPTWERWNDYGIGLLRKGNSGSDKGQLRQAEAAFRHVESLGRADGPLNLARVYLKEGRLGEAADALRRAGEHEPPAPPWSVAWFTGLVNKQNGYLEEAIENFRAIAETRFPEARQRGFDFSRDYRVLNQLGQTLFEQAKRERGPRREAVRKALLDKAQQRFERVLELDPENVTAHFNLALIHARRGEAQQAAAHRRLHVRYKPDDNAAERAVTRHRRRNPAADHAAEAVVIYGLQREGAYGLPQAAAEPLVAHNGSGDTGGGQP